MRPVATTTDHGRRALSQAAHPTALPTNAGRPAARAGPLAGPAGPVGADDGESIDRRVNALLSRGEAEEAQALLDRLGHAVAHAGRALVLRAVVAFRRGEKELALAHALQAADRFPRKARVHALLAAMFDACDLPERATAALERAADLDPGDPDLQLAALRRLAAASPEAAVERLAVLLPRLDPGRAAGFAAILRRLPAAPAGACRCDAAGLSGWVLVPPGSGRNELRIRWEGPRGQRSQRLKVRAAGGQIGAFEVRWPDGACRVAAIRSACGAALAGTPLQRPGPPPACGLAAAAPRTPIVDVIVPVFRGVDETMACLASVLASRCATPMRLLVIDDATPEPALRDGLRRLARDGRIELVVNAMNLGFTASANRGLCQGPGRDAVLLNADTEVADGWLDRLAAAARAAPRIGTVTPLTNNGQLVSHPDPMAANLCPTGPRLAETAAAAGAVNAGVAVDLPTGVGFCLYIRRACLDEVGLLDAGTFGRGYGEETDFCLRAARCGWRNVCATDVFVAHRGASSFGAEKGLLIQRNMPKVADRYPEYMPLMEAFERADPLRPMRRRLERATLRRRSGSCVLAVGIADRRQRPALDAFRRDTADGADLLWLRPAPERGRPTVILEGETADGPLNLSYVLPDETIELGEDLARLGVCAVRLAGGDLPRPLLRALAEIGFPLHGSGTAETGHVAALAPGGMPLTVLLELGAFRPGHVAVLGAGEPSAAGRLLAIARAAARERVRFFVLDRTADDAGLIRTGAVTTPGDVAPAGRAALARAFGCRVALALDDGDALREAAATAPRVALLGDAADAAAGRVHPRLTVLPDRMPPARVVARLRELSACSA